MVDTLAMTAAFFFAFWLRLDSGLLYYAPAIDAGSYYHIFFLSLPLFLILFYGCHLYDLQEIFYGTTEYIQVIKGVTFAVLGVIVVSFFVHSKPLARTWLLLFWIFGMVFIGLGRFVLRRLIRPLFRSGRRSERALVVGASEEAMTMTKTLQETGRLEIVGFLDDFSPVGETIVGNIIVKGAPADYERIAREEGVSKLILVPGAVSWETYREISFEATKWDGLEVLVFPHLSGFFSGNLRVSNIGYVSMLRFQPGYTSGLDRLVKTCLDFSLGSILFIFSVPVMLVFGVRLWLQKGWPIFERHKVLGLHGKTFYTFKFRTGLGAAYRRSFRTAPSDSPKRPPESCKQSVERTLFVTGLDKMPQLINVLLGQMSLVGPRTIYQPEAQLYDIWVQNVVAVKPGITGPWAMSEADNLQQEIATTLSYIHTWTPWRDLQILFHTLFYSLQRRLKVQSARGEEG